MTKLEKQSIEIQNLTRELEKADNVLEGIQRFLKAEAERNAALHCATEILYSPLYAQALDARKGIKAVIRTWKLKVPKAKVEEVHV
jgi:hypothetical protein